jgi:transposase
MLWLYASKVTQVAMESTGVYLKPVWNVLEKHFLLILGQSVSGQKYSYRKDHPRDAEWIADLLGHGLIRAAG